MRLTSLVEGERQEGVAFRERYRAPSVEEIDPSFIHMHPAVMERSDFEALEEYVEPVEPRVLESFDYGAQAGANWEALFFGPPAVRAGWV